MVEVPITIACGNYDRTRAIRDGRVRVEGCAVTYLPLYPEEIFFRAFRYQEFDVSELSFSSYIRTVARGFGLRRHSGIRIAAVPAFRNVRARRSGIRTPADLRETRRAARISDHGGICAASCSTNTACCRPRSTGAAADKRSPAGASARRSSPFPALTSSLSVRRRRSSACCAKASSMPCSRRAGLPRFCAASRTSSDCSPIPAKRNRLITRSPRMFPIMHLVGIRKELAQKYPWLPTSVYKAFCEAKALAMIDLLDVNALMVSLPWLIPETEDTMAVMGKDFWAYGIDENMREISALAQYLHEQGLIDRKVTVEELFHPSMFEISKV